MKFVSSLVILFLLSVCCYASSSWSSDYFDSSDSEPLSSSSGAVGKELLSIKNYQYSLRECGSSHSDDGHLHIFCEPYDFIGEVYLQFGACIGYRGLNTQFTIVTHNEQNDWINQTNYINSNCQGEIQSSKLFRSQYCYGGCSNDPVIMTIIEPSEIEPVVNSFTQILYPPGQCGQETDFIVQDNIILDTCINYREGHSIEFACNSTTVTLHQYSDWNCAGTIINNDAPTGNQCSDNFNIDTICNSAPPTPSPTSTPTSTQQKK